ncbi:MAG: long-chain-fatty-acid--CoA ligase [Acidobacteriota bacterium]|nr:long-chain-fatty-acid--CoA ligase [Acidobacteriota bacterium]
MQNNVGLFLAKRAELSPNMEGFIDADTGRRFTFSEWNRRSNRTANALVAQGVKKGDRVALLLMNSIEYMESFFALAKIGAVCVPLNWRLVPEELSFILRDAGAETLIFGEEFLAPVEDLRARGRGEQGTHLERWIHVGSAERQPEWAAAYDELQGAEPDSEPEIRGGEDDVLYIMYTSGTTGLPKGAVHTHTSATWGVLTINSTGDMRIGDRYLVALPLFHVGSLTPITCNVHRGATSVVMRAFDPQRAWQLVTEEQITVMLKVPAMLNFMLQVYDPEKHKHEQLRWCMTGAAPVPISLIEAYDKMGIEVQQVYGLTESCGPACMIGSEDAVAKAGSTGKAFFHTEVRVVDDEGNQVAPGGSGEVLVRGKHNMKEYWNRPEATAETLKDGWLHTGDVASIDEDGFIYIQDRIKDMIISGGENVYPAEIESVLMRHEDVLEAAVIGQDSEKWGESPVAILVRSDDRLDGKDVLDFCKDKLARFKQPVGVHFIDEIPRNPSGKILKRILREQFPGPAPQ